jgi:hypothetical protein
MSHSFGCDKTKAPISIRIKDTNFRRYQQIENVSLGLLGTKIARLLVGTKRP